MPNPVGGAPAPQMTVVEPHKRDWTIVRWCHKIADTVSGKFEQGSTVGKWLGRAVAAVFVPFGIFPSLVGDAIHGVRSLYDRQVEKKEAIDKKIPTKAEFEALKAEKEALLKRVSVAEAEVSKAKLESADLANRAESETDALVRNAQKDEADLKQKAQKAFHKERESKERCIRRQHNKLQAKDAELTDQSEKLKDQEQRLADQDGKIDALQRALDANVAKVVELTAGLDNFRAVAHHCEKKAYYHEQRAINEEGRADYWLSEWLKEDNKTWQDKYLDDLLIGMKDLKELEATDDCSETGSVSSFTDSDEPSVEYTISMPGAQERIVSVIPSQICRFVERGKQLHQEIKQFGAGVDHLFGELIGLVDTFDPDFAGIDGSIETDSSVTGSIRVISEPSDGSTYSDSGSDLSFDDYVTFRTEGDALASHADDDVSSCYEEGDSWSFGTNEDVLEDSIDTENPTVMSPGRKVTGEGILSDHGEASDGNESWELLQSDGEEILQTHP